jgi:hypothetical protein
MPSADKYRQHSVPGRRKVVIPWDLDLHNGNKTAALEAKKKFCARIDAAGRSPSPSDVAFRDEAESDEYDYPLKRLDTGSNLRTKRDTWRRYSKGPLGNEANGVVAHTLVTNDNLTSRNAIIEQKVDEQNDDDLHSMSRKAIVEDSMDKDENFDLASRKSLVKKITAVHEINKTSKPATVPNQSHRNRASMLPIIINASDDSLSSSGGDTEDAEGTAEPKRSELLQRFAQHGTERAARASKASSKASREPKFSADIPDEGRVAETTKNAAGTVHSVAHSGILRNAGPSDRSNLRMVPETQMETNNPVPATYRKTMLAAIPSTSRPVLHASSRAQTDGALYQTPLKQSRDDADATIVPNTIKSLSNAVPPSPSRPASDVQTNNVPVSTFEDLANLVHKRQHSQSSAVESRPARRKR